MDYEKRFRNFDKRRLVKILAKEGITANVAQSKAELIRMLVLAKKANSPTRKHFTNAKKDKMFKLVIHFLTFVVIIFGINYGYQLYLESQKSEFEVNQNINTPQIFEKGQQTFVVYNHPLVRVQAIYDEDCKRPECDIQQNLDQIKNTITPLYQAELVDYKSRKGEHLTSEYELNLLPVFLFDQTLEKLYDFEKKEEFFSKSKDKYLLQVTPNRVISGPELLDSKIITENSSLEAPVKIVVYLSPSSIQSKEALPILENLSENFGEQMLIAIKYYNTGGNDFLAATALECFSEQEVFLDGLKLAFKDQNKWSGSSEAQVKSRFKSMARKIGSISKFTECYEDPATQQSVRNHFQESGELGVIGAPTFFINNQILVGNYELSDFAEIVDQMLRREKIKLDEDDT
ncbi:thioredoxin domain-containing protein [bacterium]|jgi:protein-disulfide isomerase|nr:thioredoxin domain-containing protein [bacterium]